MKITIKSWVSKAKFLTLSASERSTLIKRYPDVYGRWANAQILQNSKSSLNDFDEVAQKHLSQSLGLRKTILPEVKVKISKKCIKPTRFDKLIEQIRLLELDLKKLDITDIECEAYKSQLKELKIILHSQKGIAYK